MENALFFWKVAALSALLVAGALPAARADIIVPGADGSDGEFAPTENIEVDLGLAATAQWDTPSPTAGNGVYDPEKWAVVFKYQRVNIPANVTVTFKNHPANPPVVWLVTEDVVIDGTVSLDGEQGPDANTDNRPAVPGPGGFRGGYGDPSVTTLPSAGFGPGGGPAGKNTENTSQCCYPEYIGVSGGYANASEIITIASRASIAYGNQVLRPLIGGSGGGGGGNTEGFNIVGQSGGAGGGAILIASESSISILGEIRAQGGSYKECRDCGGGSGSGGSIKLIADRIEGSGNLKANTTAPSNGIPGQGRIRLEANIVRLQQRQIPPASHGLPGATARLWPEETQPTLRLKAVDDLPVPLDPRADLIDFNEVDVPVATSADSVVTLAATNVSPDAEVSLFVIPVSGQRAEYLATYQSTDGNGVSTWTAMVPLTAGFSALQARAVTP